MGSRQTLDPKLFYVNPTTLEERVPADHLLRRIEQTIDFTFVRKTVAGFYGAKGNPSIDPIVLMKMLLLLFLENVKSERELVRQMAYRLDWMWFCQFDLDQTIPNHSVLSKARRLWGPEVFAKLFLGVLSQCVRIGLVDGSTIHVDASCIDGNVDTARLQPVLRTAGVELYERLDREDKPSPRPSGRLTAQSDPDAARNEGTVLSEVLVEHENNINRPPETVVADKQYGTAENYKRLRRTRVRPCIPHSTRKSQGGKFGHDQFKYDPNDDSFLCPGGQRLLPYHRNESRRRIRYMAAKGVCLKCPLRSKCTDSKHGRRVQRHMDQDHIDWADGCLSQRQRRRLMGRRKACVEGSFADAASNHGFKRARWRGWWLMRIQNLLIATCQNLRKLLKATWRKARPAMTSTVLSESLTFLGRIQRRLRPTYPPGHFFTGTSRQNCITADKPIPSDRLFVMPH